MPVLGHAAIGLATAVAVAPARRSEGIGRSDASWWTAAYVVLAYLPDIATHVLDAAGLALRSACHSWQFAAGAAGVAAAVAPLIGATRLRAFLAVAGSAWLHGLADVLQGSPASPVWPLPWLGQRLPPVIADTLAAEVAAFGILCVAVIIAKSMLTPGGVRATLSSAIPHRGAALPVIAILSALAVLTGVLRDVRRVEFDRAVTLVERRDYASALLALEAADRWPGAGKPGRIDYLRGESYAGLRQPALAETYYHRAVDADPHYFWALADLAVLYARAEAPLEIRRARARGIVAKLELEFAHHGALPAVRDRVERSLADRPH